MWNLQIETKITAVLNFIYKIWVSKKKIIGADGRGGDACTGEPANSWTG